MCKKCLLSRHLQKMSFVKTFAKNVFCQDICKKCLLSRHWQMSFVKTSTEVVLYQSFVKNGLLFKPLTAFCQGYKGALGPPYLLSRYVFLTSWCLPWSRSCWPWPSALLFHPSVPLIFQLLCTPSPWPLPGLCLASSFAAMP